MKLSAHCLCLLIEQQTVQFTYKQEAIVEPNLSSAKPQLALSVSRPAVVRGDQTWL